MLGLAALMIFYMCKQNGFQAYRQSEMPVVVMIAETTYLIKSKGTLLQRNLQDKGECCD